MKPIMINYHTPKALVAAGALGELVAWLQSQPVLGFISFVGTVVTAASTWYWTEKARKRRDRREEHFDKAGAEILRVMKDHIKAEIRAGRPDPFPEVSKLLFEWAQRPE